MKLEGVVLKERFLMNNVPASGEWVEEEEEEMSVVEGGGAERAVVDDDDDGGGGRTEPGGRDQSVAGAFSR